MSEAGDTRKAYRVSGRVQGVGFRWWTQRTARGLGVGGSVRNLVDGSVEVHAVGTAEAVSRLEEALHEGPSGSRVDRVEEIPTSTAVGADDFVIAR